MSSIPSNPASIFIESARPLDAVSESSVVSFSIASAPPARVTSNPDNGNSMRISANNIKLNCLRAAIIVPLTGLGATIGMFLGTVFDSNTQSELPLSQRSDTTKTLAIVTASLFGSIALCISCCLASCIKK